ncbi:MAG: UDP-N-acetylmuramoyl-L-alanine--D-glutamate ligase [Phycisphaeraceae bacterium]
MSELRDRRVVVMGLGRFGGGVGVARFLARQGARVLVTDLQPAGKLEASLAELKGAANLELRLGEHVAQDFAEADLVVVSPAVDPRENAYLQAAVKGGAELTSEIRLLVEHLPTGARTIGITGTAGKSTTTAMVGCALERMADSLPGRPKVFVGGNLGGSLLGRVDEIGDGDWVVLELSSFMLEGLGEAGWSPEIAAVTNFSPNHLDRHGTLEAYAEAKQQLFAHQDATRGVAVFGPGTSGRFEPRTGRVTRCELADVRDMQRLDLLVPGEHNQVNAQMALAIIRAADLDCELATRAIEAFPGLPHRLELVGEQGGVRFYNDSKCTTPGAAMLAVESFQPGRVHLIAGGYDKGSDLRPLAVHAAKRCRAVYTIGSTGDAIAGAAERSRGTAEVVRCGELERAVAEASERAREGEVVLLSPACASWDQFENYEARGSAFAEAVKQQATAAG